MGTELAELLRQARELSWARHGRRLATYLPGMFVAYGRRGRYPAVSITAGACEQGCAHCGGRLLQTMRQPASPAELVALGRDLAARGMRGMLLSGGSDRCGRLPWRAWLPAIARLADETDLFISAHVGRIDHGLAVELKAAGVRQALVDVVGEEATAREVLKLADGLAAQSETLEACAAAGLPLVPHIILGLHGGVLRGEERALATVARYSPHRVVFVVLMPLKGTELAGAQPPPPEEVARFLARARLRLPGALHHLGCARPRGRHRRELDPLAVSAGINVLALPSDEALARARELGVEVSEEPTCCSLAAAEDATEGSAT